jgi:hypothetical protein
LLVLAQETTSSDSTARVLAILALLVSVLSLGWNIYSWRASGRPLRVHAGYNEKTGMAEIAVFNTGRLPVTVEQVGLRILLGSSWYPSGAFFDVYASARVDDRDVPWHTSLPLELPPGSSRSIKVHLGQFYPMADQEDRDLGHEYRARPFVLTGTGTACFDRRPGGLALHVRFQERHDQLVDRLIKGS